MVLRHLKKSLLQIPVKCWAHFYKVKKKKMWSWAHVANLCGFESTDEENWKIWAFSLCAAARAGRTFTDNRHLSARLSLGLPSPAGPTCLCPGAVVSRDERGAVSCGRIRQDDEMPIGEHGISDSFSNIRNSSLNSSRFPKHQFLMKTKAWEVLPRKASV